MTQSTGWPGTGVPATRRGGHGAVFFTVIVSLAIVVGALAMAVVLVASGEPEALGVGLVLAMLPVGPLLACYFWLDRYEPEPRRLLVAAFFWGALVATSLALVVQAADQVLNRSTTAWSAVVVAPLTEELGKGVFVVLLLYLRRHVIDGVIDGLVYAGLVGIGFAFTENILYYAGAYTGGPDFGPGGLGSATALFVVRGVFSPFAHPFFTSAIGIAAGLAVTRRSRWLGVLILPVGYAVAVALHAAWNGSTFIGDGQLFVLTYLFAMVPGFFVLAGLAGWARAREGRILAQAMQDLAGRGYLPDHELAWLSRLPTRKAARRHAGRVGGPSAERAMRDYQRQVIALAVLHHKVMRGRAPDDYAQRGAEMVQHLAALRSRLMGVGA
jgi:RsiW-degrading membrane proteinase PrsW (M82 family)